MKNQKKFLLTVMGVWSLSHVYVIQLQIKVSPYFSYVMSGTVTSMFITIFNSSADRNTQTE